MMTIDRLSFRSLSILALTAALIGGCSNGSGDDAAPVAAKKDTPAAPVTAKAPPAAAPASTPATPAGETPTEVTNAKSSTGPVMTFERISHEFGQVPDTAKVSTTFKFTNTGDEKLIVESVKGSCGCTVPTLAKKQFMPGEGDEISVVFDPKGRPGTQTKTITVTSNSSPSRTQTLKFIAQVEPLLKLEQRFVRLDKLPVGIEHKTTINATYFDPDMNFTSVTVNQPWASARTLELGTVISEPGEPTRYGASFELTIGPDAPWGTIYATRMTINVSAKPEPEAAPVDFSYEVFLQGQIFGEIEALTRVGSRATSPSSIISMGRVDQGAVLTKTISLRRITGEPFEILGTEVTETTMDGVDVTVVKVSDSHYDLNIRAQNPTYKGLVRGIVTVSTDVEGEDSLPIRFTGSYK